MATKQLEIHQGLAPDSSGSVYWQPSSINDANDRYPADVLIFKDTSTDLVASGRFVVPPDYVGTPVIEIYYKANATTGKVKFGVAVKSIADGESADPSTDDETGTVNPTVPATARLLDVGSVSLTTGTFAAGDLVQWSLKRLGSDTTNDTLAADAEVEAVVFQYADA